MSAFRTAEKQNEREYNDGNAMSHMMVFSDAGKKVLPYGYQFSDIRLCKDSIFLILPCKIREVYYIYNIERSRAVSGIRSTFDQQRECRFVYINESS